MSADVSKKITAVEIERPGGIEIERPLGANFGCLTAVLEKFPNRDVRKLDADDAMPLRRQPDHVVALAGQRHEDRACDRQIER